MTDIPATGPSQGGSHRGRGGRSGSGGGRSRAGRRHGPRRSGAPDEGATAALTEPATNGSEPVPAHRDEAANVTSQRREQSGRGRGERGRPGGARRGRGTAGQRSVVASHRGGRGPPPVPGAGAGGGSLPGLNIAAAEFVPGQPVPPPIPQPNLRPSSSVLAKSTAADLPTRIHEDIDRRQYECVICTNEVLRNSKVWSCAICWTVTHLHCVKKWHTNQMKEREEHQGPNRPEGWRCPGCNSTLTEQPGPYRCWCGKDVDPKPIAGLPPHTCGQTCSKARPTCPHQCSLVCHAGPCPPCTLMGPTQSCFCGKHSSTKQCSETDYGSGWSCQEPCGDLLPCGEHYCTLTCHSGLCGSCEVSMPSTCYCGKERREIPCSQRDDVLDSFDHGQLEPAFDSAEPGSSQWFEGSFCCSNTCGRAFNCGHHICQKPCHPQDERAAHCPLSPDVVTHCPCGKTRLDSMPVQPRQACQDPVPHCDKPCHKMLACGHTCPDTCHIGSCQPCTQYVDIKCRCGRTTARSACHQGDVEHPHCFRVCRAQLNCGRHECGERCCSGEKKAAERRKQKRNPNGNVEPEHICLQVCGRQLKCGKHTCQQLCHKGPCMSCPEAIFDDISCACGRTVLQPPQPCGTRPPDCRFRCTRARPCGHPSVEHQCHPDETPCPKCPFLMEKPCICGKRTLKNQPCWFEEGRCGLPCAKKLKCGAHECRKTCHKDGECEDADISGSRCSQPCGKIRKSCEHTCADQCHALYACKEDRPCQSKTFITCPCQRRKQEVRCQATTLHPSPSAESSLKCDDECLRLQRNHQLAEALNVDPSTHTDDRIPYSDTTLKLFRENIKWAQEQERQLRVFAAAPEEKRLRFKPMQAQQRAFLHALAEDFGLDSESQDPDPHRHVCIFKTPRFVSAPPKTLAQCLRIAQAAANLGAGASSIKPRAAAAAASQQPQQQPFNALLLKDPRFGLTVDELDAALAPDLAAASRASGPALTFATSFLPSSDEVLIKATPHLTAAAVATSLAPTPQAVESALSSLRAAVARTVSRLGLARGAVSLCHVDSSPQAVVITRREGDATAGASDGGWSAVASRGSWRRTVNSNKAPTAAAASEQRVPSAFVALRRLEARKKKEEAVEEEKVEEDWLDAVEKQERERSGSEEEEGEARSRSGAEEGVVQGVVDDGVVHEERDGTSEVKQQEEDVQVDDTVSGAPEVAVDG
ncbi:hypothetical protein N658DRAFT_500340 [Parathielavia hyrcaniae]|uniref:R3H domain-containing protein n=1 Tax=Parathielavia hyrcaniae TaxID=113614 RepID=A0AAN6PUY1_9PEZI|nr:hypothetical protein N658DRAFT_500340 [Parathielavia hyrcaniae]